MLSKYGSLTRDGYGNSDVDKHENINCNFNGRRSVAGCNEIKY